jgi:predicted lipoprotein with Yx(FWY)xxD motif
MKMRVFLLAVVSGLAAALSAAVALGAAQANGSAGTTVAIAKTPIGRILVDSKGRTLYDFPPDQHGTSVCYGACAALWPPLTTTAKPHAGRGVVSSLLGTTRRSDGKLEVTYGGHPLYYYVADTKPGQLSGQGLNQFGAPWWALSAAGKEIHRV